MSRASRHLFLVAVGLAALTTVVAYLPGMSAGFYFDDETNIVWVNTVHWSQVDIDTVRRTLTEVTNPTRPVANISIGLNHLFSGLNPAPYHWTNLFIHLFVGLALFWVIRLFQRQHTDDINGRWLALLAVFLFLVHPLNVQAVTYVIQRMTSMAALFLLVALGSYLKARYHASASRRTAWLILAGVCFLLSIGSKETGYLLVPLILLYEVCFHYADWRDRLWAPASAQTRTIILAISLLAVALAGAFAWQLLDGRIYWLETMPGRDFSGYERVLTQLRVQFFYLSLLFWPASSRLNIDHDVLISTGIFAPITTALALAAWLFVLVFAVRNASSRPHLAFPILAYLLLHSIESAPISLEIMFEHRMYAPMAFLLLLIPLNPGALAGTQRLWSYTALTVAGLLLATATYQRNQVWGDPLAFARDTAMKSPNKFRPQYNLGTKLGPMGMIDEAKTTLERAAALDPNHSEVHNQLGNIYMLRQNLSAAEEHYRIAIANDGKNAEALFNLARLMGSKGRQAEQKKLLTQFIQHAPPYLERQKQWAIHYLEINQRSQP